MTQPIEVASVVLVDARNHILVVRKQGSELFILPGGKPQAGEAPKETVVREAAEELGIHLEPAGLVPVGTFTAPAAHEEGRELHSTVFAYPAVADAQPQAEIAELTWIDPLAPHVSLSAMLRDHILPHLR